MGQKRTHALPHNRGDGTRLSAPLSIPSRAGAPLCRTGCQGDAILRRRNRGSLSTVYSAAHNICAELAGTFQRRLRCPAQISLTSTEVGQWTRKNGFCDLPPNASLWRKASGIARIKQY